MTSFLSQLDYHPEQLTLFSFLVFIAVVNLDNSVVDLETLQALYENVSNQRKSIKCRNTVCPCEGIFTWH